MPRPTDPYLEDALRQLIKLKDLAERALAQVAPADMFRTLDPDSNSIALVVKHMAGNMRSRWTDFLTSDGEKPDRNRDAEFVIEEGDSEPILRERWEGGWRCLFAAIEPLVAEDLRRSVTIRGEAHTVLQAISRQIAHYAYHVGQIVLLARHFTGDRWQSLSIPRGKSRDVEVAKDGQVYFPARGPGERT